MTYLKVGSAVFAASRSFYDNEDGGISNVYTTDVANSGCAVNVSRCTPLNASYSCTGLSADTDTTRVPFRENATDSTIWCKCPVRVLRCLPLSVSHSRSVLSEDLEIARVPSGNRYMVAMAGECVKMDGIDCVP